MERWNKDACPGSIQSCIDALPLVQHPSAAEGTRGHLYLELVLGDLYLGRRFFTADLPSITRTTKLGVELACNIVEKLISNGCKLIDVECRVKINEDVWGTVDILLYDQINNMLMVLDYKNGTWPVPAKDNLQLLCYAWACWLTHHQSHPDMQRICYGIIQPNSSDHQYFTTDIKSIVELFDFSLYLDECVSVAKRPNAQVRAGEWCFWCNAKPKCSAYERSERDVVQTHHALSPQESQAINQMMKKSHGDRHYYQLFNGKPSPI
jgi:hypothetical protein